MKIPTANLKQDLGANVNPFLNLTEDSSCTESLNLSKVDTDKQSDDNESFYQMDKDWHVQPGYDDRAFEVSSKAKDGKKHRKSQKEKLILETK
jgi:hypothetical protein